MKPILSIRFFASESGREPVRDWLKNDLSALERKIIGEDIRTVQFGWPMGMPLVDHIDGNIWEIRSKLENRIARVLFAFIDDEMVLLHGFIKKAQKTPKPELDLAKKRLKVVKGEK